MARRARTAIVGGAQALVAAALVLAAGCGYAPGYRTPANARTIAVPIFSNDTFPLRREVEYDLTAAVRKEVQTRTDLRLADSAEADLVLYGAIRDFREKVIAEGRTDEKIESTIVIVVKLVLEDYRNGRRRDETVSIREPLSIQLGESLDAARQRALGNLAEKILEQLESWDDTGSMVD